MGGKKGRRMKYSLSSSYETDYYEEEVQFEEKDVCPNVIPKSDRQCDYNRMLYSPNKQMVFAIGPTGTGKTMLACIAAITGYNDKSYKKIIMTRPVVSVEEDIGYLPGTLEEKMDPWIRPIMDIFGEYYNQADIQYMIKEKILEICPLAYMRGRTFKDSFIIADEMQNSTPNQMKMLLTRIGNDSKMVITGDLNQHDRKYDENGLKDIYDKMKGKQLKRIDSVVFEHVDIERSPIVKDILELYGDN
jgi:phosphate starvation-inducible protein PhoH and related proteins